jgi:NADH:ubiquinone oxidoreductase subunit 6 (subunit J)
LFVRKKQLCALVAQLLIGCIALGSYLYWATFCTDDAHITSDNVAVKFICVFGDYIIVLQYINLVLFTRQYFYHLNVKVSELEHLCLQPPSTGCNDARIMYNFITVTSPTPARSQLRDQILTLVEFHNKLLDTVRSINSAYSLQILLIVAKIFFHITFCLYFVFIVTSSPHYDEQYKIHALFFILWTIFQLVFIIASCDYTKTEVSVDS